VQQEGHTVCLQANPEVSTPLVSSTKSEWGSFHWLLEYFAENLCKTQNEDHFETFLISRTKPHSKLPMTSNEGTMRAEMPSRFLAFGLLPDSSCRVHNIFITGKRRHDLQYIGS